MAPEIADMARTYAWTADDEACWQRFTKGVPDYGTDARNAGRLKPVTASEVISTFKGLVYRAAPWITASILLAFIATHS